MDTKELTIAEAATQALHEHATAKAIRSLGRKPQSPSAGQIRAAIATAWQRLTELRADPGKYKTTPELLAEIAEALTELETQAESYLNWQVSVEEDINARFSVLKTFATALVNKLAQETEYIQAQGKRIIDGGCNAAAILVFQCQVIHFDLFRFLLGRTIDEMPSFINPQA
jgi:hypothetical protein